MESEEIESEGAVAWLPVPVLHASNILVQLVVLKLNKVVKEAANKERVGMVDGQSVSIRV